jgi:hypothetical protein
MRRTPKSASTRTPRTIIDMGTRDVFTELVGAHMTRRAEAIERACEAALASGYCGVLVHDWWSADGTVHTSATPSPRVPYGHIHERHGAPEL